MNKFYLLFLILLFPIIANCQNVYEIRFTVHGTPYRAALVIWDESYGKMRVKFTKNNSAVMVEESVEENYTSRGISVFGSNAVYPGTTSRYPDYNADNFFVSKDSYGNVSIANVDDGLVYAACSMHEVTGANDIQLFLSDFDWHLNYNTRTTYGVYPQASTRYLTSGDMANLSKQELKIMRNEIFARHGYIFKTPDMKRYFNYQSWYTPKYNDVNDQLTRVERTNVELIQSYEK